MYLTSIKIYIILILPKKVVLSVLLPNNGVKSRGLGLLVGF